MSRSILRLQPNIFRHRHALLPLALLLLLAALGMSACDGGAASASAAPLAQTESHASDLIISEYIDGEGSAANDKVIEIYNGTASFKELQNYVLEVYSSDNGNSGDPQRLRLSEAATAIDPGQTIVIVKENPSSATLTAWFQWDGLLFDGNDVILLRNEGNASNPIIDSIGQLGSLPPNGTDWNGTDLNGRAVSTLDQALRRKPNVCAGRRDANSPFDPALEWIRYPSLDFSNLGRHQIVCEAPLINEFVLRHVGQNDHEFIEVKVPGQLANDAYTVLVVNGNEGADVGHIYRTYPILDTEIPANGYWTTGFLFDQFDDGVNTLLLVRGFSGQVGDDIDADNDGTIDFQPWDQIVDDVAVSLMRPGDQVYSTTVLTPYYDGNPTLPGGASRIPDGVDTDSASDWLRNHFYGEGLDCAQCRAGATPNEAVNTPGQPNRRGTSVGTVTPTITPLPTQPTPSQPTPGMTQPPGPQPLPPNCKDIIVNGSFERSHEGWQFGDNPVPPRYVGDQHTEGLRSVLLGNPPDPGSRNVVSFSSVRQLVNLPPNAATAYLNWDHLSMTQEAVSPDPGSHSDRQDMILLAPDQMPMAIKYRMRLNEMDWRPGHADLTEFVGKNFYVYFNAFNDGNGQRTWMYLDNVQLVVCYPEGMSPPAGQPTMPGTGPSTGTPMGTAGPPGTATPTLTPTVASTATGATTTTATPTTTPTMTPTAITETTSVSVGASVTITEQNASEVTTTESITEGTEVTITEQSASGVTTTKSITEGAEVAVTDVDASGDVTTAVEGVGTSERAVTAETGSGVHVSTTSTETVAATDECIELIKNGDFEMTGLAWQIADEDSRSGYTKEITYAGSRRAMRISNLDDPNAAEINVVKQVVTLPANYETLELKFLYYLISDSDPGPGDLQYVDIHNETTEQFEDRILSTSGNDRSWIEGGAELPNLAGDEFSKQLSVQFAVTNDGVAGRSAMVVDNVSLLACGYTGEGEPQITIGDGDGGSTTDDTSAQGDATPTTEADSDGQNRLGAIAVLAGILVVIALLVWGILYALRPNQSAD